jgi:putative endonuclease
VETALSDGRTGLGERAEDAAARHLEARGYRVRARRFRTRQGEIDLVVEDRSGTLAFVEVKARSGSGYGDPLQAVDRTKRERLALAADAYLVAFDLGDRPCRFDVVAVREDAAGRLAVEHVVDAFRPEPRRPGRRRTR